MAATGVWETSVTTQKLIFLGCRFCYYGKPLGCDTVHPLWKWGSRLHLFSGFRNTEIEVEMSNSLQTRFSLKTKVTFCSQADVSKGNWKKRFFSRFLSPKSERSVQGLQIPQMFRFSLLVGNLCGVCFLLLIFP